MPPVTEIRGSLFRRSPQDPDSFLVPLQDGNLPPTSRWLLWVEDPSSPVGNTRQAANDATSLVNRRELQSRDPVVVTGYPDQIGEQPVIVMTDIVRDTRAPVAAAVAASAIAEKALTKSPGTSPTPAPAGSPAQPVVPKGKGRRPAPRNTKGPK
jgi:hypothetical protein